jgi:DNA-binding NarL/FixJ family response regulator
MSAGGKDGNERWGAVQESLGSGRTGTVWMRRLVVVAESPLLVEAIRGGFRNAGGFSLVGYADARNAAVSAICAAEPDVILLDDMDRSQRAVELVRAICAENGDVALFVLSAHLDRDWVRELFRAGTTAVIAKATQPAALATLVRETVNGRIIHRAPVMTPPALSRSNAGEDPRLTSREVEILQLVASGSTNAEIAQRLWVTQQTVKFHLGNIYRKLGVSNRTQASHFAHVNGLLEAAAPRAANTAAELALAS